MGGGGKVPPSHSLCAVLVQLFNMKSLFYFKLRILSAGMIDNLKTKNITLIPTTCRSTEKFKNVGIFVPKEMLIVTRVLKWHVNTRVNERLSRGKIPTFFNISVLLNVVGVSVMFLVLRFSNNKTLLVR